MKEIKLRARLSAYSKIESLQELNETLPDPDTLTPGSGIVVSPEGDYVPMTAVTNEEIDSLFSGDITGDDGIEEELPEAVTFEEIDSLFK